MQTRYQKCYEKLLSVSGFSPSSLPVRTGLAVTAVVSAHGGEGEEGEEGEVPLKKPAAAAFTYVIAHITRVKGVRTCG